MAQTSRDLGTHRRRVTVQATVTRPEDTAIYAALDAIADATADPAVMTFSDCASVRGYGGLIKSVVLTKSDHDATAAAFLLVLFDAAPTAFEDNAAFDPSDAEARTIVGVVEFAAADLLNATNGDVWQRTNLDIPFVCESTSKDLYGVLLANDTYTPASAEVFGVTLGIEQD